jgi:thioredoxin-related protein
MRKLLVTCLIALLAGAVSAQTAPRSSGSSPRTSLTPSTSQRGNSAPSTQSGSRSSGQVSGSKTTKTSATSRSDASPGASYNPTQSRSTQTQSQQTTPRTSVARPSSNVPQQTTGAATTARTVNAPAKKAPEIKAPVNPVRVKWMTLEEALEKSKTDKRKIFVDVYTDWCGWCKRMDSTTFINPVVAQYLNDHYYPVKFNAEQQAAITYKDKVYEFKKSGARGYHELAALWLNNRLSYPTTVFLDENQGVIQPLPGYQDADKMEAILNYFGTDSHKKTPWESYQKNFNNGGGQK